MIIPGYGYIRGYTGDCSSCGYWGLRGGCTIHVTRPGGCSDYIARCNCAPIRSDYITAGRLPHAAEQPTHCASCGAPVDLAANICPYCQTPYPIAQERMQRMEQLERQGFMLGKRLSQSEQDNLIQQLLAVDLSAT